MSTYIESAIAGLGGIARTRELLALDIDWEWLRMGSNYGSLVKVRKGWWATTGSSPLVIEGRRAGGRLACVSALEHHGELATSEESWIVHIEVRRNASRIQSHRDPDSKTIVHWVGGPSGGDNAAVSTRAAFKQVQECRNLGARAIALDRVQHC